MSQKTESYKFTKKEVKDLMTYYKTNDSKDALFCWASSQGFDSCRYNLSITKSTVKAQEYP